MLPFAYSISRQIRIIRNRPRALYHRGEAIAGCGGIWMMHVLFTPMYSLIVIRRQNGPSYWIRLARSHGFFVAARHWEHVRLAPCHEVTFVHSEKVRIVPREILFLPSYLKLERSCRTRGDPVDSLRKQKPVERRMTWNRVPHVYICVRGHAIT